jgi:uncharacterized protein (TIGR02246 family)
MTSDSSQIAAGSVDGAADRAADEAALADLERRLGEAWGRDGAAFAATFTEDADFVDVLGGHIHGREAIAQSLQDGFDTFMAGTRLSEPQERTVRFPLPHVAVVVTSGNCVLRGEASRCRPEDLSIQTKVAVKRNDQWLFTTFQNNRILPAG